MEITIIIPVFNGAKHLQAAIESALAQSAPAREIIVFDDGSSDGSLQLAQSYPQLRVLTHPGNANKGLAATIKAALNCAKTPYAAFLEQDDIMESGNLKIKLDLLRRNKDIALLYNAVEPFGTPARVKKLSLYFKAAAMYTRLFNGNLVFPLFSFCPVPTFSCLLCKTDILAGLDYNTPLPAWTDRWLYTQLCFKTRFNYLPQKLTRWRLHNESQTMATLQDTLQKERAFNAAKDALYLKNLGAVKFYAVKYASLLLSLIFNIAALPIKLLFR
ncbi:MAG: glycosyltransferase family 2 protein [Elusimicrobiota bacterium]|jgi:glycosyltransferase involved in cell wall biosynthesis|nr:glycosyltransferase family 2 protein [Elusimicrobiota bacterium]